MELEDEFQLEMGIEMFADDVSGWTTGHAHCSVTPLPLMGDKLTQSD